MTRLYVIYTGVAATATVSEVNLSPFIDDRSIQVNGVKLTYDLSNGADVAALIKKVDEIVKQQHEECIVLHVGSATHGVSNLIGSTWTYSQLSQWAEIVQSDFYDAQDDDDYEAREGEWE